MSDNARFKVRMIDCVGYIVPSAMGHIENNSPRMVKTPWSDEEIPFSKAAEIGTKKVITDHSTIGVVVTTDGTISDIDRSEYIDAESRVINELKEIGKPFVVLVNSTNPNSDSAISVKEEIEKRHGVTVMNVNCLELDPTDINNIIESVLFEFPLKEIVIDIPDWIDVLPDEHYLKSSIYNTVLSSSKDIYRISETKKATAGFMENEYITDIEISNINPGSGTVTLEFKTDEDLFYKILGETSGIEINGKDSLMSIIQELSSTKKKYDKISYALKEVQETGYGIVSPSIEELSLEEPEIVKQGNRFGVRLRASAPSIHMIRSKQKWENEFISNNKTQRNFSVFCFIIILSYLQHRKVLYQKNS